jgi:16S rRNA (cytidine1402-2'-O)-methyltransferase
MRPGTLIVCANHIGNILDVPPRTIEKIRQTKDIFCDHLETFNRDIAIPYKINMSDKVVFEVGIDENGEENNTVKAALSILEKGKDVVFISDNGLPGFADRGTRIIDVIHRKGIPVQIVPGPSIVSAAVAVAGIPSSSSDVLFVSFFESNEKEKREKLKLIKDLDASIVFLDFPENMEWLINAIEEVIGKYRLAALCINVGLEVQKIIRKEIFLFKNDFPNLEDSYATLVLEGSVPRRIEDL